MLSAIVAGSLNVFVFTDRVLDEMRPPTLQYRNNKKESSVFPILNPRLPDLLLGMVIGLGIALVCHWIAWIV